MPSQRVVRDDISGGERHGARLGLAVLPVQGREHRFWAWRAWGDKVCRLTLPQGVGAGDVVQAAIVHIGVVQCDPHRQPSWGRERPVRKVLVPLDAIRGSRRFPDEVVLEEDHGLPEDLCCHLAEGTGEHGLSEFRDQLPDVVLQDAVGIVAGRGGVLPAVERLTERLGEHSGHRRQRADTSFSKVLSSSHGL